MILSGMSASDLSHLVHSLRDMPRDAHVTVYARVSDPNQLAGHGIERQIEEGGKLARALGRETWETITDEGKSAYFGTNITHGKLGEYISTVGLRPKGSILITEDIDRLSRDRSTTFGLMFLNLIHSGITIVFYSNGGSIHNSTNFDENFLTGFILFFKQQSGRNESAKKMFRGKANWGGKRHVVADAAPGRFKEPFVPYTKRCPGWLRFEEMDRATGAGLFVLIPERVEVVRRIFTDLANGQGRDSIARCLNAAGTPVWGKGVHWHGGTVQKVTENRAVLGEMQMHTGEDNPKHPGNPKLKLRKPVGDPIQDYYPAVISPELWRAARAVSEARAPSKIANTGGRVGTDYGNQFRHMAVCGLCGGPMVRRNPQAGRGEPKYKCRWSTEANCTARKTFSYLKVEEGLLRWARDFAPSIAKPEEAAALESEVAAMLDRRDVVKTKRAKLIERFGEDDDPQIGEMIDRMKTEIGDLEQRIQLAQHKLDRVRTTELAHRTLIDEMPAKLAAAETKEEKFAIKAAVNACLREFIRKIEFHQDRFVIHTLPQVKADIDLEFEAASYMIDLCLIPWDLQERIDESSMEGASSILNSDAITRRKRLGRRVFDVARTQQTKKDDEDPRYAPFAHYKPKGWPEKLDY